MPNRQMVGGELYRYAFQGQEKDPETGKEAFQLRLWDSRISRWLTTDPAGQYSSPYLGMGNNPVSRVDPDGGFDEWVKGKNGYYWDPNAISQETTKAGETYIGGSFYNDVVPHYLENRNLGQQFLDYLNPGDYSGIKYDASGYYQAKLIPFIARVFEARKASGANFEEEIDFEIVGIDGGFTNFEIAPFGELFSAEATIYKDRVKRNNIIDRISYGKYEPLRVRGGGHESDNGTILLGNRNHTNVISIQFDALHKLNHMELYLNNKKPPNILPSVNNFKN